MPRWGLRPSSAQEKRIVQLPYAIRARGRKLLEGGRARETGRWARAQVRGGAGPRAAMARQGGTEGAGSGKKKERKEMVTDRWGRAEGMTEKDGND
jgi:hypothetical protein